MTIEKYDKLNKKGLDYIIYKGKRYHKLNDTNNTYKIICDGETELYNIVKKYQDRDRKLCKKTSKNYHTLEEVLGVNPKHKNITTNYNVSQAVKECAKEGVTLEMKHFKSNVKTLMEKYVPHKYSINATLRHIQKEKQNTFTTDMTGKLIKVK